MTSRPHAPPNAVSEGGRSLSLKRRAFYPSILCAWLWLASAARVWLRRSQGCPLTLAGAEPDKPSSPSATLSSAAHLDTLLLILFFLFSSAHLRHGHQSPISKVIMTKTNDPQETGPTEIRQKSMAQKEEMRRRKGLEMDDVTRNFGCEK